MDAEPKIEEHKMPSAFSGPILDEKDDPLVVDGEPLTWEGWLAAQAFAVFVHMAQLTQEQRDLINLRDQIEQDMLLYGTAFVYNGQRLDPSQMKVFGQPREVRRGVLGDS